MMRIQAFTMQVSSSMTITPPDPSMLFAFASESKSIGTSHSSAFNTGHDDPPGITAFNFLPPRIPPPTSLIIRNSGKPIGSSYTPGLLTCPDRQNSRVPPFFGVPSAANAAPPFNKIDGTAQKVSTLLSTVGH